MNCNYVGRDGRPDRQCESAITITAYTCYFASIIRYHKREHLLTVSETGLHIFEPHCIVFKNPVALIYHLFHIFPSPSQHVSDAYGHRQVSSISLKLLHYTVCENFISRANAIFLD
jgi:hypothetical protein